MFFVDLLHNKTLTEPREAINRIELRNKYNLELGIYEKKQSTFFQLYIY